MTQTQIYFDDSFKDHVSSLDYPERTDRVKNIIDLINNEEFKEFECIAKKVRPSAKEIELNNRSRSAIMRVFKKL